MGRSRTLCVEPATGLLRLEIKHLKGGRWQKLIKIYIICRLFRIFPMEGPQNITINRGEIPFFGVFSHSIPAQSATGKNPFFFWFSFFIINPAQEINFNLI